MAVVYTRTRRFVVGDRTVEEGAVTFTGATSYATGGIPTVASDYGFNQLDDLVITGSTATEATLNNSAAGTYKVCMTTTIPGSTEIGAAGDPTGKTVYVKATGW